MFKLNIHQQDKKSPWSQMAMTSAAANPQEAKIMFYFTVAILMNSFIQSKAQSLLIHLIPLLQSLPLTEANGTAEGENYKRNTAPN